MTDRWFYVPQLTTGVIEIEGDEAHHLRSVLRLRAGDVITLFDGQGATANATLLEFEAPAPPASGKRARKERVVAVRVGAIAAVPPSHRSLTLFVAACKGPRLAWLIEKCTELGVDAILFTAFERTIVAVDDDQLEKLNRIALEACKQCRRARLPRIECARGLAERLAVPGKDQRLFVADPGDGSRAFGEQLQRAPCAQAAIVIGPEGGLTAGELRQLAECGAARIRLGAHILRVETAAVAAAAVWSAHD